MPPARVWNSPVVGCRRSTGVIGALRGKMIVVVECYCFLIIIIVDHSSTQLGFPYCKSQYILCRHSKTVTTPQTKR